MLTLWLALTGCRPRAFVVEHERAMLSPETTLPVAVQMVVPTCENTIEMLKRLAAEMQTMDARMGDAELAHDDLAEIIITAEYVALLKLRDQTQNWIRMHTCGVI